MRLPCSGKSQHSPEAIRKVFEALVARHEILRTRFQRRTGMRFPFQVVGERAELTWEEVDLSALSEDRQKSAISELLYGGSKIDSVWIEFEIFVISTSGSCRLQPQSLYCYPVCPAPRWRRAGEPAFCFRLTH